MDTSAIFPITFVVVLIFAVIAGSIEEHNKGVRERNQKRLDIKNEMRKKYYEIKIGTSLQPCVDLLGQNYSVEKEQVDNGKTIKVLKWHIFGYVSGQTQGSYNGDFIGTSDNGLVVGSTSGMTNANTIRPCVIKLTFENDLLVSKEQEGIDTYIA